MYFDSDFISKQYSGFPIGTMPDPKVFIKPKSALHVYFSSPLTFASFSYLFTFAILNMHSDL